MGKIIVQADVFVIIAVTSLLILFCWFCNRSLKRINPFDKPSGLAQIATILVSTIDNLVIESTNQKKAMSLAPYIGTLAMYLLVCNLLGLIAFDSPTANFSVTLTLALITFILREREALKTNGIKGYMHAFIEPFPPFIIPNLFGKVAPLISMSLRLFGNLMSGAVIMGLVYTFTGWLTSLMLPFLGGFNVIGPLVAPVLHGYFDVFSGSIQMFIFITLTMVYIGIELPTEN